MMMESNELEKDRAAQWRRTVWLMIVAIALLVIAVVLAWLGSQRTTRDARQLAIVSELQLGARDVSALSSLAAAGNPEALTQLRDRVANVEAMLAVLMTGGTHKGTVIAPAAGALSARMQEFTNHWTEYKRRVDSLLVKVSPEAQTAKDTSQRRLAEKRSPGAPPPKTATARSGRDGELSASALSLVSTGHGLAGTLDSIRTELDGHVSTPWLNYLAALCVLGAVAALTTFAVWSRRSGEALARSIEQKNAQLLDALRPAMRTMHIAADADTDPAALGQRLSAEVVSVIDGVKTLVKALDTATAEADKFAVVGHVAARALASAEQKAAETSRSLQATARRIAAVYAALSASSSDMQGQLSQLMKIVDSALGNIRESANSSEQLRGRVEVLVKRHVLSTNLRSELAQRLFEVADRLTQAEGLALRAVDRLANAGAEAVAFANDVRGCLGPSVAILKQARELALRADRETGELANELTHLGAIAANQSRNAASSAHALAGAEAAVQALSAKLSAVTRLASANEGAQLLSALDESVGQITQSSASARQVLDATQNAASRIEDLAKLLNTMKPS